MELHKYNSNFGKALFLSWFRSILYVVISFFVILIVGIITKEYANAGIVFLIVMFLAWPVDLIWRWKSVVLMGDELIIKRIFRPKKTFLISQNLITYSMSSHGLYGGEFYVKPVLRAIDRQGGITDIRLTFFSKKAFSKLLGDIDSNRAVLRSEEEI